MDKSRNCPYGIFVDHDEGRELINGQTSKTLSCDWVIHCVNNVGSTRNVQGYLPNHGYFFDICTEVLILWEVGV